MKKVLKYSGITLLVVIFLLVAAPFLFKDKLVALIKQEANKSLTAKLEFSDVDLSLLRSFPDLSLQLEKLTIINGAPFEGDTLIAAGSIGITLDVMSVINGSEIKIKSVSVNDAVMNFSVDKDGRANWDIAKPSVDTTAAPSEPTKFKANLKRYTISNSRICYDDRSLDFYLLLEGLNHEGKGDFTQDLFTLSTRTNATAATMKYEGVPYISHAKTTLDADIDMDMKQFKFVFKENKIVLNELEAGVNGWVAMPDTNIDMELNFNTAKTDFKTILSMIPAVYAKEFPTIQASGKLVLEGYLKGRYNAVSMPGFGLTMNIDNGRFKYPSLPAAVSDIFVDLKVTNPDGVPDHTSIDLSRFHANIAGDIVDARLLVHTPVSDPDLDAFLKGRIDLSNVSKFYPLEQGTELSGKLQSDVTLIGKMSAIEKNDFDRFTAAGNLSITGMKYAGSGVPKPILIQELLLSVNPKNVSMPSLKMEIGKSSISADGSLDNLLGYMLKEEVLHGRLNISANQFDLNEWMSTTADSAASVADTAAMTVLEIPASIDFSLNTAVGALQYDDLTIKNVKGNLIVKDQTVAMKNVAMELLDGSMVMNGSYSSVDPKSPSFAFDLNVSNFDIQQTVKKFLTVEKLAPLAKNCSGKFGTTMNVTGNLDDKMSPVLNTLSGAGKLSTSSIVISGFKAFDKLGDALRMPSLKRMEIPAMNPSFRFVNGRVYVDPFELSVNGFKSKIVGSNGFDQSIDYTMNIDIPRSALGGAANAAIDQLFAKANAAAGTSVKMSEVIPVTVGFKGTVTDPKITTDLNTTGAKAMDAFKAAAQEEFEKQKAAMEAKAREEADKLKAEGEARLAAEKAKAQAEADRMKKEAEARAKAVADSIKKAAEKEAKKAIDQLNPFKKK
jgi:hypothetical protein